eukprot:1684585-Amphidinium_carterae.1
MQQRTTPKLYMHKSRLPAVPSKQAHTPRKHLLLSIYSHGAPSMFASIAQRYSMIQALDCCKWKCATRHTPGVVCKHVLQWSQAEWCDLSFYISRFVNCFPVKL